MNLMEFCTSHDESDEAYEAMRCHTGEKHHECTECERNHIEITLDIKWHKYERRNTNAV